MSETHICWFKTLTSEDTSQVGGKNASLGEMIQTLKEAGIRVPSGFATTASAYWAFLEANDLPEQIEKRLEALYNQERSLQEVGKAIRHLFRRAEFPAEIADAIREAYHKLSHRYEMDETDVAARSSATAEDLPEASFAGQQETFLNVTSEDELLEACRNCYASLFTDRAISYRKEQGFDHLQVALSVDIQKMVRSDKASSGVMFTMSSRFTPWP